MKIILMMMSLMAAALMTAEGVIEAILHHSLIVVSAELALATLNAFNFVIMVLDAET